MEQYAQNLVYTDEEKVITYCKNIVKAVEKTRDVYKRQAGKPQAQGAYQRKTTEVVSVGKINPKTSERRFDGRYFYYRVF